MKIFITLLLLLPYCAFAEAFDPVRLDPASTEPTTFFYPLVSVLPNGNLLGQWSSVSDTVGAYGREITTAGNIVTEIEPYDEETYGTLTCPPLLYNIALSNGGLARFIFHS